MPDRTQEAIFAAFNRLIAKENFDKITINKICEEADVSRATFYRYFIDKYDVMNYNYRLLLDDCVSRSHNFEELFIQLYINSREVLPPIRRVFGSDGDNSYSDYVAKESIRFVEKVVKAHRNGKGFTEEERLQADLLSHGIGYITERWVSNMYDLSPEEAAHAMFLLLPEDIRNLTF